MRRLQGFRVLIYMERSFSYWHVGLWLAKVCFLYCVNLEGEEGSRAMYWKASVERKYIIDREHTHI